MEKALRFFFLLVSKSSAILLLVLSVASSSFANSATWKMSPATGDWNHAANWMPSTIPDGPSDTATFASSSITNVYLSGGIEIDGRPCQLHQPAWRSHRHWWRQRFLWSRFDGG